MPKLHYYEQMSIEDAQDAVDNYEDNHYDEFHNFLFHELLSNIKKVPFDYIIQNHLPFDTAVYRTKEANGLSWLYTADRKLINSITIYSFRFTNTCHPEFYRTFETEAHHLFQLIPESRHRYYGWYMYKGCELLDSVDKYLNIQRVVQNPIPHATKLFINQKQERIDIRFDFDSIKERIVITFEPGPPYIHT
jgi:hypothetical protein